MLHESDRAAYDDRPGNNAHWLLEFDPAPTVT